MTLKLGDEAPDFEADTTEGRIKFHDWIGDSWAVLFSHPKDFTPVCTTELGYMARINPEFGGAHRGEVRRVREQHRPGVADPVVEFDAPLGRVGLEVGRRVAKFECHGCAFLSHMRSCVSGRPE